MSALSAERPFAVLGIQQVAIAVEAGQKVRTGERLAVIEAMKMENIVVAAHDGVVARIVATAGESVAVDEVILEFAASEVPT